MDLLRLLPNHPLVEEWKVLENRKWQTGHYYKLRITLPDQSVFQATEYKDEADRSYSFHWQDKEGNLRLRWDNAPHYRPSLIISISQIG
ncbi:MAG: DUF6516 family protein [Bacteroidota bacterium]